MNAMMNITVRVTAAAARKEIESLRAEVAMLRGQMGMSTAASTGMISAQAFTNISKWGSQMQWAGRQLVANFTLPLAAAGYAVTKLVLDNEAAMVRIQKVYGDAATGPAAFARDVGGLSKAFDLLSVKYAQSRSDVMNIAADWAAAGAQGGALARGVEATLKTMVLGEMDAADATQALIAIQAQYGTDTKGLIGIIDVLNATENTTGVTFEGLVQGMARSASAARSAGVDVEHLSAMIAAISPAAGTAAQAGNSLKTIFSRMLGPTGEARDVMAAMGINIDDMSWKSLNGAERLTRLADAYMHLEGAGKGMISSQAGIVSSVVASRWQINRFDVLMRDLSYQIDGNSKTNGYYSKTLQLLADKSAVAKLAQSELNSVLDSNPYVVKRAGVVIQNSLIKVVTALLPQILWLVNSIATLAQKFSQLDPGLQKMIIGFLAFLAVLGPPLVLLGSLAVAVGRIGLLLASVGGVASKFFGSFAGIGSRAIGSLTGAIGGAFGFLKKSTARVVGVFSTSQATIATEAATGGTTAGAAFSAGYEPPAVWGIHEVEATFTSSLMRMSMELVAWEGETAASVVAVTTGGATTAAITSGAVATGAGASTGFRAGFMGGLKSFGAKILIFLRGIGPLILSGIRSFIPFIVAGMSSIVSAVATAGSAIIAFMTGPWGIAIIAVVAILVIFRKQIGQFFSGLVRQVQDATTPLGKGWQGIVNLWNKGVSAVGRAFQMLPEGVRGSLLAVLDMVKKVALNVYKWFSYLNPFAHHSPSLVENVTSGLAVVGDQFGLVASVIKSHMLNAYGSLNGFGTAVAGFMAKYKAFTQSQQRETIGASAGPGAATAYDSLIAQLGPLEADLATVSSAMNDQQVISDGLSNALDNAKNAAKVVQDQFDALDATTSNLSSSLSDAKTKLSDFASTPIAGMRAMSNAIFDNQMAEKALQLQMLNLNNVSLSDLQGQLASLQGDIESLRGTQADLRASGAGGDILQAYQDQINTLQSQGEVIKQQVAPLNDLQSQLDALQKVGQKLDLEQSLAFDPLTRQIEQLTTSYNELPFNDIITGIQNQKAVVDQLQTSYDTSNAALAQQKILLDQANASVSVAQTAYDSQAKTLDALKQVYSGLNDQISAIKDSIDQVIQAAGDMASALQSAGGSGSGASSPALQNFLGAAGGAFPDVGSAMTISGETGSIDAWLNDFMSSTTDKFSKIDIFTPIKLQWAKFTGWWGTNVSTPFADMWQGISDTAKSVDWLAPFQGIVDWFKGNEIISAVADWWGKVTAPFGDLWAQILKAFSDAYTELKPSLDKLKDAFGRLFDSLKQAWDVAWPVIKTIAEVVGVVAGAIILLVAGLAIVVSNILANVIMPVVNFITNVVNSIVKIFTGLIEFFTGVFTGDWGMAWQGILDIVSGIWDLIAGVFKGAWDIIVGIVKGLIDGVVSAFTWLTDTLNIDVPAMIASVIQWFRDLPGKVPGLIEKLVYNVVTWFLKMAWDIGQKMAMIVSNVADWFKSLPGRAMDALGNTRDFLVDKGIQLMQGMHDGIKSLWENIKTWFTDLPSMAKSAIGDLGSMLWSVGGDLINGLKNGIIYGAKNLGDTLLAPIKGAVRAVTDFLGIHSPSRLLMGVGKNTTLGYAIGVGDGAPSVKKSFDSVIGIVRSASNTMRTTASSVMSDSVLAARVMAGNQGTILVGGAQQSSGSQGNNFYGDLSFPNITNPEDAKKFIENLSDLAGSGGSR